MRTNVFTSVGFHPLGRGKYRRAFLYPRWSLCAGRPTAGPGYGNERDRLDAARLFSAATRAPIFSLMNNSSLVFTPAAQKAQGQRGSAKAYEQRVAEGFPDTVTAELAAFL